jgi:hypothetical protein
MIELENMNQDELINECRRWRDNAPSVVKKLQLLNEFLELYPSPEILKSKVEEIRQNLMGAISLKDKQIEDLERMVEYLQNDPFGLDRKFKKPTKFKPH